MGAGGENRDEAQSQGWTARISILLTSIPAGRGQVASRRIPTKMDPSFTAQSFTASLLNVIICGWGQNKK